MPWALIPWLVGIAFWRSGRADEGREYYDLGARHGIDTIPFAELRNGGQYWRCSGNQ
jgi:hypothetical protein